MFSFFNLKKEKRQDTKTESFCLEIRITTVVSVVLVLRECAAHVVQNNTIIFISTC